MQSTCLSGVACRCGAAHFSSAHWVETGSAPRALAIIGYSREHGVEVQLMSAVGDRANAILREYHRAEDELLGRGVVLTDGKVGTIERLTLDEAHGLRLFIAGHDGIWPVSTIKFLG